MADFALQRDAVPYRALTGIQWRVIAILAGLFFLALIPRITTDTQFTYDETNFWIDRTENFHAAIADGRWADTLVAYHPGTTTTWLSASGLVLDRLIFGENHKSENMSAYVAMLRLPLAVFHALCIVLAYLLLRRLIDARVALLGCLFWAVEPFIIGHSQIIHTDGTVMSFSVLAFLTALIAFKFDDESAYSDDKPVRWGWLLLSGVLGGLTIISKLNGVVVAFAIAGVLLYARVYPSQNRYLMFLRTIRYGLIWTLALMFTAIAFMPVLWADPAAIYSTVIYDAARISFYGHSTFLLGDVYINPPLHFFPITVLMRLTPWAVIGGAVAVWFIARHPRQHTNYLHFAFFVVLFIVVITTQPKKMDRYILPVYPLINVIAAYGWVRLVDMLVRWRNSRGDTQFLQSASTRRNVWIIAGVATLLFAMSYNPHYLMYYNPMFGGIQTAERAVLVGWGEGLDAAAEFIMQDTDDVCEVRVASHFADQLMFRHLPDCTTVIEAENGLDEIANFSADDYVVLYINEIQRYADVDPVIPLYMEHGTLLHTVDVDGVAIAYVYAGALPDSVARR